MPSGLVSKLCYLGFSMHCHVWLGSAAWARLDCGIPIPGQYRDCQQATVPFGKHHIEICSLNWKSPQAFAVLLDRLRCQKAGMLASPSYPCQTSENDLDKKFWKWERWIFQPTSSTSNNYWTVLAGLEPESILKPYLSDSQSPNCSVLYNLSTELSEKKLGDNPNDFHIKPC